MPTFDNNYRGNVGGKSGEGLSNNLATVPSGVLGYRTEHLGLDVKKMLYIYIYIHIFVLVVGVGDY
jgi:hypothetical protein